MPRNATEHATEHPTEGASGRPRERGARPLDRATLERLALTYVGRYATTRAKLRTYLARKIRERGWDDEGSPLPETHPDVLIEGLIARCAALGYVDDRQFAVARAAALGRRGYGARRVSEALRAAGIEEGDARPAREEAGVTAWATAIAFARRRRIGAFATTPTDPDRRRKALAAMLRAGHAFAIARRLTDAAPGETLDPDCLAEGG